MKELHDLLQSAGLLGPAYRGWTVRVHPHFDDGYNLMVTAADGRHAKRRIQALDLAMLGSSEVTNFFLSLLGACVDELRPPNVCTDTPSACKQTRLDSRCA